MGALPSLVSPGLAVRQRRPIDAAARGLLTLLLVAVALGAPSPAQVPPRTLAQIPRQPPAQGAFRVWTFDQGNAAERTGRVLAPGSFHGVEHPMSTWSIGSHVVAGLTETWSGCAVPGRLGSFDLRKITMPIDAYHAFVRIELRPNFAPGSGVAVHRLRWAARLDPTEVGISNGEARVLLPATGAMWVRDAKHNLTRHLADTTPGNELWLRPYWPDRNDPRSGFYYNRLNIADLIGIHGFDADDRPRWGLGLYVLDVDNADPGHLLIGSNPDAAGNLSLEFGYDFVLPRDHVENNATPGSWITITTMLLRSLPSVTPKEYAWWEHVDFTRDVLLGPLRWVHSPSPLSSSPAWAKTAVLGSGYVVDDLPHAIDEAARLGRFFTKYSNAALVAPEFHYAPCIRSWSTETYSSPPRTSFVDVMARVRALPDASRTHVLTDLVTSFFESWQPDPPHPIAAARAFNDQLQPYSINRFLWFVDPSDPAFVAAFDGAVAALRAEGVGGAYFDNMFGDLNRNYHQHEGADRRNQTDQVALLDRARRVLNWVGFFVGEQSRLGNRYAAGALLPCGFRSVPGGSGVPFIDAVVHEHRSTYGAGDLLEQWVAHGIHAFRTVANPTRRDLQNITHDYVFGFVKGQLIIDGRTEYADPSTPGTTVPLQIFEVDPAVLPPGATRLEQLGFEVLKDVADSLYPRMMWWRSTTPALQSGRMLVPPYPTASVNGRAVDEWFVLEKEYFFKMPNFAYTPATTSDYETERFPVSFWAMPSDPTRLTLFMGNPTYDPVTLRFRFRTADYPQVMAGSRWRVVIDPDPEAPSGAMAQPFHGASTSFDFALRVPPLSFRRVTLQRQ